MPGEPRNVTSEMRAAYEADPARRRRPRPTSARGAALGDTPRLRKSPSPNPHGSSPSDFLHFRMSHPKSISHPNFAHA